MQVTLRTKADRRVKNGHPWVFSNEIEGDIKALPAGGLVDVHSHGGAFLGRGYANPRSLIAIRLLTRNRREDVDHPAFYVHRLTEALAYREAVYPGRRSARLVFAEADGLPGLVIDRYDDVLAVQITTLGMEVRKDILQQALEQVFAPRGAVLRNDTRARELEGLEQGRSHWFGELPEHIDIDEHGVRFRVRPLGGQKTGHFFDQADNRRFAAGLSKGRRVLDVYSNTGGWALHALVNGAASAITVDSSEEACEQIAENAELNGVADRLTIVHDEGKRSLERFVALGERFGSVVIDPPAFAKARKVATRALHGYRDVNALALALVEPGGFLFTSSCSYHVEEDKFIDAIHHAVRSVGRRLRMVRRGEQASDHPVVPAIPETRYLKSLAFQVVTAT